MTRQLRAPRVGWVANPALRTGPGSGDPFTGDQCATHHQTPPPPGKLAALGGLALIAGTALLARGCRHRTG